MRSQRWWARYEPMHVALVVAVFLLAITGGAWHYTRQAAERDAYARFMVEVGDSTDQVRRRVDAYIDFLYSARALFAVADEVSRADWSTLLRESGLEERYPGFQGVSFVRRVAREESESFERRVRADRSINGVGYPDFRIQAPGDGPDYYVVEYVEPFAKNSVAFGLDYGGEPGRRAAAERARDSGRPAVTGPIRLIQDGPERVGVVIMLPVYRRGLPAETVRERRDALIGFVAAVLRMDDLMRGAFSGAPSRDFGLDIYDGPSADPANLLYSTGEDSSASPRYALAQPFRVADRTWMLSFRTLPHFQGGSADQKPWMILFVGILVSGSLSSVVWSLGAGRSRAAALAAATLRERREVEELFRSAFDHSAIGMAVVDYQGVIQSVNQALGQMLGYSQAELVGRSFSFLTHPEEVEADWEIGKVMLSGALRHDVSERRYLHRDGHVVCTHRNVSAVYGEDGRMQAFIAQIQDITARKQAEEERRHYEQELEHRHRELRYLIQHMAEGVVAVDGQGRILVMNAAAVRMLRVRENIEGHDLAEVGLPVPLVESLGRAAAGEGERTDWLGAGGVELRSHITPVVTQDGRTTGAVALLQDVTHETELERMRESFVANVSHELRAPLATLSGVIEAVRDGLVPEDARKRYLQAALSEIGRLHRLTNELMELSRLSAGIVAIQRDDFDVRPLCEGLAERWGPRCAAARVTLEVSAVHCRILADYDRVEQVLSNLLDNAVRFTPAGGKIRLFAEEAGAQVKLGVADSGIGIAPQHLPFIWDRFYKVDRARTPRPDTGTGLGLAIVQELVERMGGAITVDSEVGRGTTFTFTLPRVSEN